MKEKHKNIMWDAAGHLLKIGILSLIINSAFPDGAKNEVRKVHGSICRWCNKKATLEFHNRIAQRDKGSNSPYNAVGLCDPCHEYWDAKSQEGVLFPIELMPIKNPET